MIEFNATILVSMISFVIFMFIMNIIFYKPIFAIIQKRQEYVDSNNLKAQEMSDMAKKYQDDRDFKIISAKESLSENLKSELEVARLKSDEILKKEKVLAKESIVASKQALISEINSSKAELGSTKIDALSDLIIEKLG